MAVFALFFAAGAVPAASARFAAQRLLVAAMIAALPARLSVRFGLSAGWAAGAAGATAWPRILAHRCCWASRIRWRVAALRRPPLRAGPVAATGAVLAVPRNAAIYASIWAFCNSKPVMAA